MTNTSDDRRAAGRAAYEAVYGDIVPAPPPGAAPAFELLGIDQQFAEVWTRPGLAIPERRLLTIGVLASVGNWSSLELVTYRALQTGELTPASLREVVIHLISYLGTTKAGDLLAVSERAIATHQAATSASES
jgi:alkylhydroperoxidase/carboxymuconolactone decarboxylase family protein YurZ